MINVDNYTRMMKDMMGAMPMDDAALQNAFKLQAAMIEHMQQGVEAARAQRLFREDAASELDFLLGRHIRGAVAHLRALHVERANPVLDAALQPMPFAIGLERMAT